MRIVIFPVLFHSVSYCGKSMCRMIKKIVLRVTEKSFSWCVQTRKIVFCKCIGEKSVSGTRVEANK